MKGRKLAEKYTKNDNILLTAILVNISVSHFASAEQDSTEQRITP
jgi:hypothetical protein